MNPNTTSARLYCAALSIIGTLSAPCLAATDSAAWQTSFESKVIAARESAQLVGLGAIVMQDGEILALSASGERVHDSGTLVSVHDKWHLGSISKSMTATLVARLVEKDTLKWSLPLKEVFSDIHPDWQDVTLLQLLSHTSGAQRDLSMLATLNDPEEGEQRTTSREKQVLKILHKAPKTPPGDEYHYSNVGYTIAGVVAEKIAGQTWEALIREEIFNPLNISSGGFGAPHLTAEPLEQPKGHSHLLNFVRVATIDDELSSLIGPAGSIHMSLTDLMAYADNHLQGERGVDGIVSATSYKTLHSPIFNNYALGWNVSSQVSWSSSPIIWHAGSNGMWCAVLALLPEINASVAVTTNDCNDRDKTFDAIWDLIESSVIALQSDALPL